MEIATVFSVTKTIYDLMANFHRLHKGEDFTQNIILPVENIQTTVRVLATSKVLAKCGLMRQSTPTRSVMIYDL